MSKISRAELTISRSLRALAIAQEQAPRAGGADVSYATQAQLVDRVPHWTARSRGARRLGGGMLFAKRMASQGKALGSRRARG
jgi:hypothetical protein